MGTWPESAVYELCILGHLDSQTARRFEEMTVSYLPQGITLLVGPVMDQAALYGLLSRVRDLGVPLMSVQRQDWKRDESLSTTE